MAAMTTALIASAVIAAGTSAYQIEQSNTQRAKAADQERMQKNDQEAMLAKQAQQKESDQQTAIRDVDRAKQRTLSSSAGGRQSTILTSPLGVTGSVPQTANKTALGQ